MKIIHISDTHGERHHTQLQIPECDVIIHSGDIGGRTSLFELRNFLEWFSNLPAQKKVFIAGNHDICLDENWSKNLRSQGRATEALLAEQNYRNAINLISEYDLIYLCDQEYVWEGVKFYGSPYSPSFHRDYWVFNADRGEEIRKVWSKIPGDTNILITHGPPYTILDRIEDRYKEKENEDMHVGCKDLFDVIKKRLFNLELHCFGHIHDQIAIANLKISNTRRVLFSNGAVVDNQYNQLIIKPLTITI